MNPQEQPGYIRYTSAHCIHEEMNQLKQVGDISEVSRGVTLERRLEAGR